MKRITAIFILILAAAVILAACSEPAHKVKITKIENVNMEKLKKMTGTYVGDNNKVYSIVQSLPGGETVKGIDLSAERIKVTYGLEEGSGISQEQFNKYWFNGKNVDKQNFYYNAIYLALLVPNSKGYSFEIEDTTLDVTRQQVEKELKEEFKDFPDVNDEEAVTKFIDKNKAKLKELASEEYQAFQ
ncbi:DUF4825 domain-containing protein [Rossellomorea aquimaris]|uniref:DUF4825 domain-containing protein n=1 Tax=Rossellomorea aquimaris TaxID=189382 RepID=A0A1J6WQH8_9BACI|nr:DUF4825 domain-containing protein [Rossellomorea aquimaris]OIU70467.1 hypothetical protein BHE18_12200 [Rossellomorea aquimaris]